MGTGAGNFLSPVLVRIARACIDRNKLCAWLVQDLGVSTQRTQAVQDHYAAKARRSTKMTQGEGRQVANAMRSEGLDPSDRDLWERMRAEIHEEKQIRRNDDNLTYQELVQLAHDLAQQIKG